MSEDENLTYPSVLCAAIATGDTDLAKSFIQLGANPNLICPKTGRSPINIALLHNQFDIAKSLIEKGGSLTVDTYNVFQTIKDKLEDNHYFSEVVDFLCIASKKSEKKDLNAAFKRLWFSEVFHQQFYFTKGTEKNRKSVEQFFELCFTFYQKSLLTEEKTLTNTVVLGRYSFLMALTYYDCSDKPWVVESITQAAKNTDRLQFFYTCLEKIKDNAIDSDKAKAAQNFLAASQKYLLEKETSDNLVNHKKIKL